jgi:hypothetical protein
MCRTRGKYQIANATKVYYSELILVNLQNG